ncbi:hypothetical protein Tco_1208726, partial [Tanacetum coccineum]
EEIYKIAEMSKSSVVDKSRKHTSSIVTVISKSETMLSESSDTSTKALETVELTSSSLERNMRSRRAKVRNSTLSLVDKLNEFYSFLVKTKVEHKKSPNPSFSYYDDCKKDMKLRFEI